MSDPMATRPVNRYILGTILLTIFMPIAKAQSLNSQINAVANAQHDQSVIRAEQRAEMRRRQNLELARERRAAAARAAKAAAIATQNRAYQLEQRQLQLTQEKLNIKAQATLVNRENDIINAKIAREKAGTNLVQSQANATNSVSQGEKKLLQDTGTARINTSLGGKPTSKNASNK